MPIDWAKADACIERALFLKVDDTRRYKTPPKPKVNNPHPPHLKGRKAQSKWWRKHKRGHSDRWYDYYVEKWSDPEYLANVDEWHEYDTRAALHEWQYGEDYIQRHRAKLSSKDRPKSTMFPIMFRVFGDRWVLHAWGPPDDPRRKRLAWVELKEPGELEAGRILLERLS